MKKVYSDTMASVHWSAAKKKSAFRPADKPVINRGSTGDFVPPCLHRISLVRASGEAFKRLVFDALESTMDLCFLGE